MLVIAQLPVSIIMSVDQAEGLKVIILKGLAYIKNDKLHWSVNKCSLKLDEAPRRREPNVSTDLGNSLHRVKTNELAKNISASINMATPNEFWERKKEICGLREDRELGKWEKKKFWLFIVEEHCSFILSYSSFYLGEKDFLRFKIKFRYSECNLRFSECVRVENKSLGWKNVIFFLISKSIILLIHQLEEWVRNIQNI